MCVCRELCYAHGNHAVFHPWVVFRKIGTSYHSLEGSIERGMAGSCRRLPTGRPENMSVSISEAGIRNAMVVNKLIHLKMVNTSLQEL